MLPGFVVGMLVFLYLQYQEVNGAVSFLSLTSCLAGIAGAINAYLIYAFSLWLDRQMSWQRNPGSRMLTGLLLNELLCFSLCMLMIWAYVNLLSEEADWIASHPQTVLKLGVILLILNLLYTVVYFAVFSYQLYSRGQIEPIQIERQRIELQLQALKSQLGPHFLFNGLNTIANLIVKDAEKAETFIRQLAQLYQYTLGSYRKEWVTVREELAFVDAYLFLLKTRFEEMLQVDMHVPETIRELKLPPMSIQMLVENATKHNQMSQEHPLRIVIEADQHRLTVSNTIHSSSRPADSLHIGLENIRRRYQLLSGKQIQIEKDAMFRIHLPLIE